ncbi:hypothetical protein, partial [Escherichia sp. TW14182]
MSLQLRDFGRLRAVSATDLMACALLSQRILRVDYQVTLNLTTTAPRTRLVMLTIAGAVVPLEPTANLIYPGGKIEPPP